jgi:hypothetical protein
LYQQQGKISSYQESLERSRRLWLNLYFDKKLVKTY